MHVCGIRYIHPYMYMKKPKVNVLGQDLSWSSSPFVLVSQETPWTFLCPMSSSRAIGVHSLLHLAFMWVPGIRLRSSFLCSELFTHCVIFLDPTYFFFFFLVFKGRVYIRIELTLLDLCSHFNMMSLLTENLFNLFTLCKFSASEVLRHCCSAKATKWLGIRIPCGFASSGWLN